MRSHGFNGHANFGEDRLVLDSRSCTERAVLLNIAAEENAAPLVAQGYRRLARTWQHLAVLAVVQDAIQAALQAAPPSPDHPGR